jgi:hypothetical protein
MYTVVSENDKVLATIYAFALVYLENLRSNPADVPDPVVTSNGNGKWREHQRKYEIGT